MKSKLRNKSGQNGFTLIELLIVIAIIAILASMLLPVLSSAQRRAQALQCMNNTKQLGTATFVYLNDNNDFYPYGVDISDTTWSDPTAWHIMFLQYIGGVTNLNGLGSKVYICPADTKGTPIKYPSGDMLFQEDYRANDYIFRDSTRNKGNPLRSTTIRVASSMMMITEKDYDSPTFQTDSADLGPSTSDWLGGWNGGSRNYLNSGFEWHGYLPTACAADGHACRFQVPSYGPGSPAPPYYPGLGDAMSGGGLWSSPAPVLYMRNVATTAGF